MQTVVDGGSSHTRARSFVASFALETRWATGAYWLGVTLVALSVFVPRLLPFVDYPQHLALADVARRLGDPSAPEQALYVVDYFTFNGLFHLVVAALARVMPVEVAGRVVVALTLLSSGGAVVALLRTLDRPPAYAALFTPTLLSFSIGWGFINYAFGSAIALVTAVFVARALKKPSARDLALAAALSLLCALAHGLAMLLLCLLAASLAPELAIASTRSPTGRLRLKDALVRSVVGLAPLLTGCIFCLLVYRAQHARDPQMYAAPPNDATPNVIDKASSFLEWTVGLPEDRVAKLLLLVAIVMMALIACERLLRRRATTQADAPLWLPALAATLAYFATPIVLMNTHLIFPRLTQLAVLGWILALPRVRPRIAGSVALGALAIGVLSGVDVVARMRSFATDTDDASRVIDDAPSGRRAAAVVYGPTRTSMGQHLVHLAAYYGARKGGDWAYSFGRFSWLPVHYKQGAKLPAWPDHGWEFSPWDYDPRSAYARSFDLLIVRAPGDLPRDATGEPQLRAMIFKEDADAVKLVSHHGEFWAFDTAGLPTDGTN